MESPTRSHSKVLWRKHCTGLPRLFLSVDRVLGSSQKTKATSFVVMSCNGHSTVLYRKETELGRERFWLHTTQFYIEYSGERNHFPTIFSAFCQRFSRSTITSNYTIDLFNISLNISSEEALHIVGIFNNEFEIYGR